MGEERKLEPACSNCNHYGFVSGNNTGKGIEPVEKYACFKGRSKPRISRICDKNAYDPKPGLEGKINMNAKSLKGREEESPSQDFEL